MAQMNLFVKTKQIHRHTEQTCHCGGGGWGGGRLGEAGGGGGWERVVCEFGVSRCKTISYGADEQQAPTA